MMLAAGRGQELGGGKGEGGKEIFVMMSKIKITFFIKVITGEKMG